MEIKYIGTHKYKGKLIYTATLYRKETDPIDKKSNAYKNRKKAALLWGDRAKVIKKGEGKRSYVQVRGMNGWVDKKSLKGKSLLEFYFIDVGQGDGVLIRTPDHKHILIDGGWPRSDQPLGKNACDFVDWKFKKDYGKNKIELDAIICSHNDQDHYGALWDMFNPKEFHELDVAKKDVSVEKFYHAGLSWWEKVSYKNGKKKISRTLGKVIETENGKLFSQLLSDRRSVEEALKQNAKPRLQGEWRKFLSCIKNARTKNGAQTPITRLGSSYGYLDGFKPENTVTIKVLGPVDFRIDGQECIRWFPDGDSKNTNGNSVLLRVDYGNTKVMLTGDLNFHSQTSLLKDYEGKHQEFYCDVAKSCHHGSEDISYSFLKTLNPIATIISSGDSEGHDHPRPNVVAASGKAGRSAVINDHMELPLVYSTELARSVKFSEIINVKDLDTEKEYKGKALNNLQVSYKGQKRNQYKPKINERMLAVGVIYGLINVRTDGETILCAALNEKDDKWNIKTFKPDEATSTA